MIQRRFSVLDSMILVAATAVGLGVIRTCSPELYTWPYSPIPPVSWFHWSMVVLSNWVLYLSPLPGAWTLALLAARLRSPRPSLRRLMRQPGVVAGVAATTAVLAGIGHYLLDLNHPSWHTAPFETTHYALGVTVGAAWIVLALSSRWRAEPSWIDRLGRSLGIYWILASFAATVRIYT